MFVLMKNQFKMSIIKTSLLIAVFSLSFIVVSAQCPNCAINFSCSINPPYPTICPDSLPTGMAGHPYDTDVSFWMPANFNDPGSGLAVTLNQVTVLNMVGLPFGLNWQTNSPTNIYYPSSNPPTTEYGCAKVCGTPSFAGSYVATVYIHVEVSTMFGNQSQDNSFTLPITILPDTSGTTSFTIINPLGCGSVTSCFQTNIPSLGQAGFSYAWDFGNGLNSTQENPPCQTYTPGTYDISCHTIIDTLGFNYLNNVTVLGGSCNDWPFSDPDFYFIIKDPGGNAVYTSAVVVDQAAPVSFSVPNVILYNQNYTIEVWDEDGGLGGADDACHTFTINGLSLGGSLWSGSDGISYSSTHPIFTFDDTASITVYPNPSVPIISVSPNDTICQGDSILLTSNSALTTQWYNDTLFLLGSNSQTLTVGSSGKYWVEVTDNNGCVASSAQQQITVIAMPAKPTFWRIADTLFTNSAYSRQWYLNGSPIPGATGLKYVLTVSGNYSLSATNQMCIHYSDTVNFIYSGIQEYNFLSQCNVFPNPNNGNFIVSLNVDGTKEISLIIKDVIGKIIWRFDAGNVSGNFQKKIDLSSMAKGLYFLEVSSGNPLITRKIIVD